VARRTFGRIRTESGRFYPVVLAYGPPQPADADLHHVADVIGIDMDEASPSI